MRQWAPASRALIVSSIEAASPGLDETDVRVALFERLYGGDFDDGTRARIVARLRCQADA